MESQTTKSKFFSNKWLSFGTLFFLHLAIALFAFTKHFTHPLDTIFTGWGDGLKNNFTLFSFVKSPIGKGGVFKYNVMDYPFGDYVFSTDNTPLFSVPFRWFCHHVYDLSDYTLAIFNFIMIANIILCGLLVYLVFKKLLKSPRLAWLLALILPWTNFQLARLFRGHYNLSLTSLCVFALLLFLLWKKYEQHQRKRLFLLAGMIIFSYFTFLIHGYYIVIIPVFISCMLLSFGIYKIIQKQKGGLYNLLAAITLMTVTAILAYATMLFADQYYHLRASFANGYDWMEQKTNFSLLFTHYSFQHFYFPIWSTKNPNDIELMCYLGNIGLYTMAILFTISLFSQRFRRLLWTIQKEFFSDPLKGSIFFAGLVLLSMSFGERYYPLLQPLGFGLPFSINESQYFIEGFYILLFSIAILITLILFLRQKEKIHFPTLKQRSRREKTKRALLFYLSSAILIFIMFGHYNIGHWVNMTNPLWVAHKFTRLVEQFRSLVRFAWPFYWTFYVWIGFTLSALYIRMTKSGKLLMILIILLVGGTETIDFVRYIKHSANSEKVIAQKDLKQFNKLSIDWSSYQAILPVPYFLVGCEIDNYNYTIDDIADVSELSYQLSTYSHLPLMAGKLSRTTYKYNKLLLEVIINDKLPAEVEKALNHKPILLFENRKFINDSTLNIIPQKETKPYANEAFWKSQSLIQRHHLKPIDSLDDIYFYKWDINP